jgi:hypothetical protein
MCSGYSVNQVLGWVAPEGDESRYDLLYMFTDCGVAVLVGENRIHVMPGSSRMSIWER